MSLLLTDSISYLLLLNNLSPKLNGLNEYLLSYCFCGSGIWEGPGWGWRIYFQNGSFTWLLAGGLSSLLAVGKQAQFTAMWAPPWRCLSIFTTWQLASQKGVIQGGH